MKKHMSRRTFTKIGAAAALGLAALGLAAVQTTGVLGADDRAPQTKAACTEKSGTLTLDNGLIRRVLSTKDAFRTVELTFLKEGRNLVNPGANGKSKKASDSKDKPRQEVAHCREVQISIDGQGANLGRGEGFEYDSHEVQRHDDCLTLSVRLTPTIDKWKGLVLHAYYTLYDNEAFFVKWVKLTNNTDRLVTVTRCQPEVLTMPVSADVHVGTAYDKQVVRFAHIMGRRSFGPGVRSPFRTRGGCKSWGDHAPVIYVDHSSWRNERFGFAMMTNYATDRPISLGGGRDEFFSQFPGGPNVRVKPGKDFESFLTYFVLFEGDIEDGSLALRRMVHKLCPWANNFLTLLKGGGWSKARIDQAAELGFDVVFAPYWQTGVGTFQLKPELRNMRSLVDYAHSKGLKVSIYTTADWCMDPATLKRYPQYINWGKNGKQTYPTGNKPGGAMCGCSGWHEHILKHAVPFLEVCDFDIIDPDGAGLFSWPCYAKDHPHGSPEESVYMNWRLICERFALYRKKGWCVMAPGGLASIFWGNSSIHTYGTEKSTFHDPYEFILATRKDLYRGSFYVPGTADNYMLFLSKGKAYGWDIMKRPETVDYYLASVASYGVNLVVAAESSICEREDTRKVLAWWTSLIRKHRDIMCRDVIHLAPPTGKTIDAIMHVADSGPTRGFLAAFNPTRSTMATRLVIPQKYLGNVKELVMRDLKGKAETRLRADTAGNFLYNVEIPPLGYHIALATVPSS